MQINLEHAVQTLKSVDQKLKEQVNPAKSTLDTAIRDTVDLSPGARALHGSIQSPGATQLYGELSHQLSSLTDLIENSTGRQKELSGLFGDPNKTDAVRERAQELLDSYFNVENTATRIFNFAFSHYDGGDRETFAREMQGHIYEGFRQAEKIMGGLADISLETRDAIDNMVEDFIDGDEEEELGL